VRGGRRARRAARDHRLIQATEAIKLITGIGEPADRPAAALRRARMSFRELKLRGFPRAYNLKGGIDEWSVAVDASVTRY
jgi:rhodanese-related sulfurtransferase